MAAGGQDEVVKAMLPFLQRADELQKHDSLVAYYCRMHALEVGVKLPDKSKGANELINSVFAQLEKDKQVVKRSNEDNLHIEGFALNVFNKADKQDRAGNANISTAKTFYAAGLFLDVLSQFGPLPPELEQKQKYAIWKASDIRKALKEGRTPTPGPPSGDPNITGQYATSSSLSTPSPSPFPPAPEFPGAAGAAGAAAFGGAYGPPGAPSGVPASKEDAFGLPSAPSLTPSLSSHQAPAASGFPRAQYGQPAAAGGYGQIGGASTGTGASYGFGQPSGAITGMPGGNYAQTSAAPAYTAYPPTGAPGHDSIGLPGNYPGQQNAPYRTAPSAPPLQNQGQFGTTGAYTNPASSSSSVPPGPYPHSLSSSSAAGPYPHSTTPSYPQRTEFPSPPPPPPQPQVQSQFQSQGPPPAAATAPAFSASLGDQSLDATRAHPFATQAGPLPISNSAAAAPPTGGSSSSQPTPGRVADAHKAARFAVGALAFDDVPTAIEYLKKSLDLLTKH